MHAQQNPISRLTGLANGIGSATSMNGTAASSIARLLFVVLFSLLSL